MSSDEINTTKQILESKLHQLSRSSTSRDSIAVEHTADPLDTTQGAVEREMETRRLDHNAALIRQVRAAIHRIERGEYGVCLECETPISKKRLVAVPWAALCIHCQEYADLAGRAVDGFLDDGLASSPEGPSFVQ
ncbi:MAG TPA: TraR/DksA family transcriptional regulator [Bryobacteraceae bacterium]|jgi:DnaK suppressor protein|nr:TraR/DksA family transcriptional regulator [Bryobacteraceae bacterium]